MSLEQYRRKRDFAKTPEPSGAPDGSGRDAMAVETGAALPSAAFGLGGRFVVGRHRATRLHYDLRLEIGGVLVSWAVPKGPTLDPDERRMAIHVEDHPLDYFAFEDVIPRGEYGAGDAIVWDWGTFEPEAPTLDPVRAIRDGELKFRLDGQKLHGRFTIVRTGRPPEGGESEAWLLIHKKDPAAVAGWDAEDHPESVKTGRTNVEVAEGVPPKLAGEPPMAESPIDLSRAVRAPMPGFIEPMLATLATDPFDDPEWLFEIKWDGYRVEAVVRGGVVRLHTRNGKDAATYFPKLLTPPDWIDADEAIVDGEVVALDETGRPDFGLLQERIGITYEGGSARKRPVAASSPLADSAAAPDADPRLTTDSTTAASRPAPLAYQAFDLLYLDGWSLLKVPLEERKRLLRRVLREHPRVRYAAHIDASGRAFLRAAEAQGLEGIVAKHRRSTYEPNRRSSTWLKLKIRPEQEFVVGGYLPGEGNAKDLGAVLVGYYDDTLLRYAGRVGSGFDGRTRRELRGLLDGASRETSPFDPAPERKGDLRAAVWAEPTLVIRAAFSNWTRDGVIRQPSFKGFEPGREPASVTRERAVPTSEAERAAESEVGSESPDEPATRTAANSTANSTAARDATSKAQSSRLTAAGSKPEAAMRRPASRTGDPSETLTAAATAMEQVAPVTEEELAALDALDKEGIWSVGGFEQKLTNLDKVLFPPAPDRANYPGDAGDGNEEPITKRELIRYLVRIAPTLLPHLHDRALNLQRFPDGVGGPSFWQKQLPPTAPAWLTRWRETGVDDHRAPNIHLIADRVATLAFIGNQAAFEFHPWTSRIDRPWEPTFALIDIDPGANTTWEETFVLAKLYRTALDHLGVVGCPKTTGKRGIQVWIPIVRKYTYQETSAWVEQISRAVGAIVPDLVSWEWSKSDRRGKARLDYTQNASIKTLVAPYAVRPAAGAPVSTPIAWDELDDPDLRPDRWTIRDIVDRVEQRGDLFAAALTKTQELPKL